MFNHIYHQLEYYNITIVKFMMIILQLIVQTKIIQFGSDALSIILIIQIVIMLLNVLTTKVIIWQVIQVVR